jgi:hypothetical protein
LAVLAGIVNAPGAGPDLSAADVAALARDLATAREWRAERARYAALAQWGQA